MFETNSFAHNCRREKTPRGDLDVLNFPKREVLEGVDGAGRPQVFKVNWDAVGACLPLDSCLDGKEMTAWHLAML